MAALYKAVSAALLSLSLLSGLLGLASPAFGASEDDRVRATLEALQTDAVSGRFHEEKAVAGFPKPMVSEGVFSLAEGTLRWNAETLFPSKMTISAQGIVFEAGGSTTSAAVGGGAAEILSSFLSGRIDRIQARFDVRAGFEGDRLVITAVPKDDAMRAAVSSVTIRARGDIESAVIESAAGDVTTISFTNVRRAP